MYITLPRPPALSLCLSLSHLSLCLSLSRLYLCLSLSRLYLCLSLSVSLCLSLSLSPLSLPHFIQVSSDSLDFLTMSVRMVVWYNKPFQMTLADAESESDSWRMEPDRNSEHNEFVYMFESFKWKQCVVWMHKILFSPAAKVVLKDLFHFYYVSFF